MRVGVITEILPCEIQVSQKNQEYMNQDRTRRIVQGRRKKRAG